MAKPGRQQQTSNDARADSRKLGFPATGLQLGPLFPALWVAFVWAAMVMMLGAVGYLDADGKDKLDQLAQLKRLIDDPVIDVAARRASLALSGVTLAITLALSFTGVIWAYKAFQEKSDRFRWPMLAMSVALLVVLVLASWYVSNKTQPFPSALGRHLLGSNDCTPSLGWATCVPDGMFLLACVVPCVLLAGATFLLEPMDNPPHAARRSEQLQILLGRVRELDQMLYLGALALVFGTLQLSAGLSVPLASMPKATSVKAQAELCKLMSPASAPSAFYQSAASAATDGKAVDEKCRALPAQVAKIEPADALRQLVRSVTFCFGLAFSALLAAVYVPSLIGLGLMIEERQPNDSSGKDADAVKKAVNELDPLHRIAAVFATLSPLLAGIVANVLSGG